MFIPLIVFRLPNDFWTEELLPGLKQNSFDFLPSVLKNKTNEMCNTT